MVTSIARGLVATIFWCSSADLGSFPFIWQAGREREASTKITACIGEIDMSFSPVRRGSPSLGMQPRKDCNDLPASLLDSQCNSRAGQRYTVLQANFIHLRIWKEKLVQPFEKSVLTSSGEETWHPRIDLV
jgi:hypothetical protein